jgi:ketosteroid isomerase-like protein
MSEQDVEVVRDQFAAVNERDFPRAMSLYADDVVLTVAADAFLEAGTFEGREAVGEWFGNWFRTFQPDYHFELEEARDLGHAVLIVANHHGHGRTSGAEVRGKTAYLYGVSGGKVARVELYASRDEALEAATRFQTAR